jgi:predicted transcriptional regulator with HTH domain
MKYLNRISLCLLTVCILASTCSVFAQTDTTHTKKGTLYTLVYNEVPDNSKLPLIGFVNKTRGNHSGLQLGFVNINQRNFTGLQIGFVSLTKGNLSGSQISFLNFGSQTVKATQIGFGNHAKGDLVGSQLGFFNVARKNTNGLQLGFVNETRGEVKGVQLGFVNEARKNVNGCQIGFLNVADSISKGVPIGFFSYIKKGGYRAVEISANELYPANVSFKTGVPLFYSIIQGSYNNNFTRQFALGTGLGSLLKLKGNLYFNPEAIYHSSLVSNGIKATALRLNLRYSLSSHLQIAGGISFVQLNQEKNKTDEPWFNLTNFKINDNNRLLIGGGISLSYNFTQL